MSFDQSIRKINHKRIDFFRSIALRLSLCLFAPFNRLKKSKDGFNVLVFRTDDKLGDSVTSSGFLQTLKSFDRNARVVVVSGASTAQFYEKMNFVDQVYTCRKGVLNNLILYSQLKKESFDYIVNTSHILNPRTVFLIAFTRAYEKIGFGNSGKELFQKFVEIDFIRQHVTDRYRSALELLGVKSTPEELSYHVDIDPVCLQQVQSALVELRKKYKTLVGLNSFAGAKLRNLSEATTKSLVQSLVNQGDVGVISLANEGDHRILQSWMAQGRPPNWHHFSNLSSLGHNTAVASVCDVIITPDTAWVHLASGLKKKLIAIYRQDSNPSEVNSVVWAPRGTEFEIIWAPSLSGHPDDINRVRTEDILAAFLKITGR